MDVVRNSTDRRCTSARTCFYKRGSRDRSSEWQKLYTAIRTDDKSDLMNLIDEDGMRDSVLEYLSQVHMGMDQTTFLHETASRGSADMLRTLLDLDCDPTVKNAKGQVPYQVAMNRPIKQIFVEYRVEQSPDRWDWAKALIPLPVEKPVDVDPEREAAAAEKKRRQKQQKREREKVRKAEETKQRSEQEEQQRYLALSDREKRALAAERRMLQMSANTVAAGGAAVPPPIALSRCFQCAADITGKVPFEYSSNRFCSTSALPLLCSRMKRICVVTRSLFTTQIRNMLVTAQKIDPVQAKYMEEQCILVDESDRPISAASKRQCHSMDNIRAGGALHRAFSVFLFNSRRELLMQKRSLSKITFPSVWTNSCCSHPLFNAHEMDYEKAIGVRRAAQRKLVHELGFKAEQINLDDIHYMGRFLYKAESNDQWGEHELDYALVIRNFDAVPNLNPEEVAEIKYVNQKQLQDMIDESNKAGSQIRFSPWFSLLAKHAWLNDWWNNLDSLDSRKDATNIIKLH
uniref:isopentenyl-diphosphate Delta-isomerase n=1 Tax=Plectus sambesii TaxID=2011161 RepID=A0A914W262_9BILA